MTTKRSTNATNKSVLLILACAICVTTSASECDVVTATDGEDYDVVLHGIREGDRLRALRNVSGYSTYGPHLQYGPTLWVRAGEEVIISTIKSQSDVYLYVKNNDKLHIQEFNINKFELLKPIDQDPQGPWHSSLGTPDEVIAYPTKYVSIGIESVDYQNEGDTGAFGLAVDREVFITLDEFNRREEKIKREEEEKERRENNRILRERQLEEETRAAEQKKIRDAEIRERNLYIHGKWKYAQARRLEQERWEREQKEREEQLRKEREDEDRLYRERLEAERQEAREAREAERIARLYIKSNARPQTSFENENESANIAYNR